MMSLDKNKKGKKPASANSVNKSGLDLTDSDPVTNNKSNRGDASLYTVDAMVSLKHDREAELKEQVSDLKETNKRLESRNKQLEEKLKLMDSTEIKDVTIQQIYQRVIKQREEIQELVEICNSQKSKMKSLKEAVESGRCAECALRSRSRSASQGAAAAGDDRPLKFGTQCTSDNDADAKENGVILLNDGRTLSVSDKSWTACSNQYEDVSVCGDPARSSVDRSLDTVERAAATGAFSIVGAAKEPRSAGATLVPSSREDFAFSLQQSSRFVETSDGSSNRTETNICPFCKEYSSTSPVQLQIHVNNHFPDDDTVG